MTRERDIMAGLAAAGVRGLRGLNAVYEYMCALAEQHSRYARLMRLHRPIGIWLLLWPTLWALWLAGDGQPTQHVLVVFVLGTVVMRSAGCIVNDLADRNIDPHVERTADRPLATGEVAVAEAVLLFLGLMLIALGLVMSLDGLVLWFAGAGAIVTIVYPFMKRFVATPQFVLGIAFSWGVPMAFAAELGTVPRIGWLVFVVTVIWVVVYDTMYAIADRDEDLEIGVRSTAILFGDMDRVIIGGLQLMFLGGLALVGLNAELGRWFYAGIGFAALFALYQQHLIRNREPAACVRAFLNNAWLGGAVFAGLILDYTFR